MINKNISCNVKDCKYHAQTENYCTLNSIQIVNHTTPATTKESTDCASFEKK